jgi:hypothetical protein
MRQGQLSTASSAPTRTTRSSVKPGMYACAAVALTCVAVIDAEIVDVAEPELVCGRGTRQEVGSAKVG